MVALRVIGLDGDWRTITYDTVAKYRFEGRTCFREFFSMGKQCYISINPSNYRKFK